MSHQLALLVKLGLGPVLEAIVSTEEIDVYFDLDTGLCDEIGIVIGCSGIEFIDGDKGVADGEKGGFGVDDWPGLSVSSLRAARD